MCLHVAAQAVEAAAVVAVPEEQAEVLVLAQEAHNQHQLTQELKTWYWTKKDSVKALRFTTDFVLMVTVMQPPQVWLETSCMKVTSSGQTLNTAMVLGVDGCNGLTLVVTVSSNMQHPTTYNPTLMLPTTIICSMSSTVTTVTTGLVDTRLKNTRAFKIQDRRRNTLCVVTNVLQKQLPTWPQDKNTLANWRRASTIALLITGQAAMEAL
jgi:hypothetical protein